MTDLTYKIGAFDSDTRSVTVTFSSGDLVHTREVNAVLTADGEYDEEATAERVAEVARGVAVKIGLGVITNPAEPEPAAESEAEADTTTEAPTEADE